MLLVLFLMKYPDLQVITRCEHLSFEHGNVSKSSGFCDQLSTL